MNPLKMSLVENSDNFLKEALSKAIEAESESFEWKFAILHLVQAIELALKERLSRTHSILIFSNIDKPHLTVSLDRAINRLANISNVKFDKEDIRAINTAREWRNHIVHHKFDFNVQTIKPVFGKLFGFLSNFNRKHLEREISKVLPDDLWKEALKINEYSEELLNRAVRQIKEENQKWVCTCIRCWNDTFVDDGKVHHCYLCGFDEPTTVCQECGEGLFISEAHQVYYGKSYTLKDGKRVLEDWHPHLCGECYEKFIENKQNEDALEMEETV